MYQEKLQKQIIEYLRQQNTKECDIDYKHRQEIINYFENSEGECAGLSTLWVYAKRISQVEPEDPGILRDDIKTFYLTQKLLLDWDQKSAFDSSREAEINRFIENVLLYQRPAFLVFKNDGGMQMDLAVTLEDTKRGSPIEELNQTIICSEEILHSRLKQIIQE